MPSILLSELAPFVEDLDWVIVGSEMRLWRRVPFFLKQSNGQHGHHAVRELDDRTWDEFPGKAHHDCILWVIQDRLIYGAGSVTALVSRVTAPVRDNALPSSAAPVPIVMEP